MSVLEGNETNQNETNQGDKSNKVDNTSSGSSNQEVDKSIEIIGEHYENISHRGKNIRIKGVFWLPNIITSGSIFSGIYCIIAGMEGFFISASIAIFFAMILDFLDGRVARMTHTESNFGKELDSLADVISFGVAPATLAFSWLLSDLGKIGWLITFVYVLCTALRLARFNIRTEEASIFFSGFPSTSAAGVIAGFVWVGNTLLVDVPPEIVISIFFCVIVMASVMMVSSIPFYSFKTLRINKRVSFFAMFVSAMIITVVGIFVFEVPQVILWAIFFIYMLSGPIMMVANYRRKKVKK